MRKHIFAFCVTSILAWVALGCHTTENVTRRSQLTNGRLGQVTVLATDSTRYILDQYVLDDSTLSGIGVAMHDSKQAHFNGSIALSNIRYIQSDHQNGFKSIVALAATCVVGYYALSAISGGDHIAATGITTFHSPYGGSTGSSCPYIYSYHGTSRSLEAEAYGVAWGSALEMSTIHVLPSLSDQRGLLRVDLANERPETHYHNAVTLYAVEHEPNATVVADPYHQFWPVVHPCPPLSARDRAGTDILSAISRNDGVYWETDLHELSSGEGFQDMLEVELPPPPSSSDGTLIIQAINTGIIEAVLAQLSRIVGDNQLEFVNALEHDPEMIALMKEWTEESSLKVEIWDGGHWCKAGRILPEATAVPFTRSLRISGHTGDGKSVKVRLRALTDVWKIDGITVDWSPAQKLHATRVPLVSAVGPDNVEVSSTLAASDDRYLVLLPGESVSMTYSAVSPSSGKKMTYAIDVQGYLHEWMRDNPSQPDIIPASFVGWRPKLACLKTLLHSKELILPSIYEEWNKQRQEK